jgi:CheY-like chemotaxis protein
LSQLLNTTDYSYTELAIALTGSVLWILSYLLLVKDAIKNKFVEIPFFAVCGNLAWEFLFAFVFVDYINLGQIYIWGYQAWFLIDIAIVILLFMYGKKQVQSNFLKKYFRLFVPLLIVFYGFLLYFWISMGFDNTPFDAPHKIGRHMSPVILGATSAFILNLVISTLYIRLFLRKGDLYPFSFWNGVFRWSGTALFTVLFHLIDPGNMIVTTLGILIFFCDLIYLRLVFKKSENKTSKLSGPVPFVKNETFETKWFNERITETYNGINVRVVSDNKWHFQSESFECQFSFYEGNLLYQHVIGKMTNEDALTVVPMISQILKEMECEQLPFFFISESTKVKLAEPEARKMSMEFFEKSKNLKEFIVVVSPIVKVMLKMAPTKAIVDRFIITKSKEEAFDSYFRAVIGDDKKLDKSRFQNKTLQTNNASVASLEYLTKALSLNQFDKLEAFVVQENDRFSEIYEGIKLNASDKKLLIKELNDHKDDFKKKLEQEHTLFSALFQNSGLYSVILDMDLNVLDSNEITKSLFKELGVELITGYNMSNFVTKDQFDVFEKSKRELENNNRITFYHKQKFPNGFIGYYETSFFKLDDKETPLIGVVSLDITDRRNLEKDKIKLVEDLQSKNTSLQSFHHTISHHLNHEIANIEQIVSHINDPLIDVRKKLELIEDLTKVTEQLNQVKSELNHSLKNNESNNGDYIEVKNKRIKSNIETILLLDDDPITNSVNKLTIKSFSPKTIVSSYRDARKAIDGLKQEENLPDVIFLDINMPVMSGWDFLEEFNEFAAHKRIKIYILTSSESTTEINLAMKYAAVEDFISKPLNMEKLEKVFN